MSVLPRIVGPADAERLADLFAAIDTTFFGPHPLTREEAHRIADADSSDVYAIMVEDSGSAVAYGMLRGLAEGYPVPSLGIAVHHTLEGRGIGRKLMLALHDEARRRGAPLIRLRVHPENSRARHLYETLGYRYAAEDRGELVMLLDLHEPPVERAAPRPPLAGRLIATDDPAWTDLLARVRHDFHHLPAYAELCAADAGDRPVAAHVSDGERSLLLPLVLRRCGEAADAASPYGYPGPLATDRDPAFLRMAMATVRETLHARGIVSAFIRMHPILNPGTTAALGTLVEHGDTVGIDLTRSPEEIWRRMRSNHRRDITRARRDGWAARVDPDWTHYRRFQRLYRATMDRLSAADHYLFDGSYFDGLRAALGDRMRLWVVERDGVLAAAALFVTTGDLVDYHLSGFDPEVPCVQPTKLLIHAAALAGRDAGARVLLLGGGLGARDDSLLHFKAGFSPDRYRFRTLRMVLDTAAYAALVRARDPRLDPRDTRSYFPLYRAPADAL